MSVRTKGKLRVALECRIPDVRQGHGTVIRALAQALSSLGSSTQEYTFIVSESMRDWLAPHVSGPCRLAVRPTAAASQWRDRLRKFAPVRELVRTLRGDRIPLPASDGFIEQEGFGLVHFPTQVAYTTSVPSIYQPWDLQHLHHPEFFRRSDIVMREVYYRAFCRQAAVVCVSSQWTKQDLVERYGLNPQKIVVVRWGPGIPAVESTQAKPVTASAVKLPRSFFFYPAAMWPHKNHKLLLQALYELKTQAGRSVDLCLTGSQGENFLPFMKLARQLGVESSVHHLGFVQVSDLHLLFAQAEAMVFPSRFEGFGLPILEAFQAGTPVLCARSTVLPETAGEGAAYFDPDSPSELARLMLRILDEPEFRSSLIEKGQAVLQQSTMTATARAYQQLYASLAAEAP